uniref:Uncharacterized protein n=1 Tax=Amazona collaria TaxID=241587 RepID=A0A8B9FMI2_9PSIT
MVTGATLHQCWQHGCRISSVQAESWTTVCHHLSSWTTVCHHPLSWTTVCHHPLSWTTVCHQPPSWTTVCHKPPSWITVCHHPLSWTTVCHQPLRWTTVCHQPPSWTTVCHKPPSWITVYHHPPEMDHCVPSLSHATIRLPLAIGTPQSHGCDSSCGRCGTRGITRSIPALVPCPMVTECPLGQPHGTDTDSHTCRDSRAFLWLGKYRLHC